MENKIKIPNPCNENWNSMLANKNGRFCDSCSTTVVDFTKMDAKAIQHYFIENAGKETICGRFKSNQIETKSSIRYDKLKNQFSRIRIKPIQIMALFSLSLVFTLNSCFMGKRAEEAPIEVEKEINNDSINENKTEQQTDSLKNEIIELKKK